MADPLRIRQLLEDALDSNRTPEEICRDDPDLLREVRAQWDRMRSVEAQIDVLFPGADTTAGLGMPATPSTRAQLPAIPGYELEGLIGHGGMGVVYKARHQKLNRSIAIKMMLSGWYAGPWERQRLLREAEAMASLRHAHIVQVYDVGEVDGLPYFTMEFVEGGNLSRRLAGTPRPAREAATLVATLAGAVQAAHESGIVHRDLKPANILLTALLEPKITDFGLARRIEEGPHVTLNGARVGTPSYMAPEQAIGNSGTIGPAADIYALGAILYETLTGRPPFRGETVMETERQVLALEPVPPSRLNAQVPRDLETICLKCLRKSPANRYATARALEDDLNRFLRLEPIAARPAGPLERSTKWVRRHPSLAAVLTASALLAMALIGGGVWLALQEADRRHAVEADLIEVAAAEESARWRDARTALDRAAARLGGAWSDDLRQRLAQARRDLDLVIQLDTIRQGRATRGELVFYKAQAARHYQHTFQAAGLASIHDPPEAVAAAVHASAVRWALQSALDDWAICAADKEQSRWVLAVARAANRDPGGWAGRILDPAAWDQPEALSALARTVPLEQISTSLALALGERLRNAGGDAVPFLKQVQKRHPTDFWANLVLGNAMLIWQPVEAGGYYRAALASRPGAAVGYCVVGDALQRQGELPAAIDYYRKALELDPGYARALSNLGQALQALGQIDPAIAHYRKAIELDPEYAWAHNNLGNALLLKGQLQAAYDEYQQTIRFDPKNPAVQSGLRQVGMQLRRGEEVRLAWKNSLADNPPEHEAWFGYAELCLFLGKVDEYRLARAQLLDRFGSATDPILAERTGRACLLFTPSSDELAKATALIDLAVAADKSTFGWASAYFMFAKGLAEYRHGHLESVISIMDGPAAVVPGLEPGPRLVLAMARHNLGQSDRALETLATAISAFDWREDRADSRDTWILHVLRREAENLVLADLPELLSRRRPPRNQAERLAMLGACQFQARFVMAAHLYKDAFTADPKLADDPRSRIRYHAACAAALAAAGQGQYGDGTIDTDPPAWRRHARDWLRADLVSLGRQAASRDPAARLSVQNTLAAWKADPALAGLREPGLLNTFSPSERAECQTLWTEVETLGQTVSDAK